MKFFHFLTYAIVLGFFVVACTAQHPSPPTAHIDTPRNAVSQNRILDTEILPPVNTADSLVDQLPQH